MQHPLLPGARHDELPSSKAASAVASRANTTKTPWRLFPALTVQENFLWGVFRKQSALTFAIRRPRDLLSVRSHWLDP
jgi:hypothetical protein